MKKHFYLTTSIAYTNAPPHLGHALELVQADAIARYRRMQGDAVFFATGTDEHGIKIARRAEELNMSPQALVDANAEKFRQLREILNLSWDSFIRTTDKKIHWPNAIKVWKELYKKGDLYRKAYEGLYCVGHEAFVTKKDLNAEGLCEIHKTAPETVREENWFFRLSKYVPRIKKIIAKNSFRIIPESRKNEMLGLIAASEDDGELARISSERRRNIVSSYIAEGVGDVSFSRPRKDLQWGIPVPGDETQTMYVWADALVNYLSHIMGKEKQWWPPTLQIVGKDILRFHALIWLGMLLSLKKKLPKELFVHGFVTIGGEKMSKSLGNIIDPFVLAQKYGTDALRYYLLAEIPSDGDGDFTEEKFLARYQGDLANGLGNLVARVAALGERISPILYSEKMVDSKMRAEIKKIETAYCKDMENLQFHAAIHRVWEIIGLADRYINKEKPWAISDQKAFIKIIINVACAILAVQRMIAPFLPETAEKIAGQFKLVKNKLIIKKGEGLFPRFEAR